MSQHSNALTQLPYGTATLADPAGTRVVVVPALGGKITELHLGGRQWLWHNEAIPYRAAAERERADDASYVELADTGGYDECFPTVGRTRLGTDAGRYAGLTLPDHGELWSQRPEIDIETREGVMPRLTTVWRGRRMPYVFARAITIEKERVVRFDYGVRNEGDVPLPFLWSSHPLFPLTGDTRLELPAGARVRAASAQGIGLAIPGQGDRWPMIHVGSKRVDFSRPSKVGRRYACKLFIDCPAGPTSIAVREGRDILRAHFDGTEVPNVGIWINRRGWTPFARGRPYENLGLEPCIGAPDTLGEAMGAWSSAHRLGVGEERTWTIRWQAEKG